MFKRDLALAVRELLERHLDVYQIAARLQIDPPTIQAIIDTINNTLT